MQQQGVRALADAGASAYIAALGHTAQPSLLVPADGNDMMSDAQPVESAQALDAVPDALRKVRLS